MTATPSASRALPELPPSSRYELLFKLASGGMASVYVGRLRGAGGFWRLVAIKKAHAHLVEDPSFRRMLVEEARLASKIHHPNVVPVFDVEQLDDQLLLVMDYIEGASLADLLAARPGEPLPPRLAVRIALDACAGLHAAHALTDAAGKPLHIVHRDVSPHNLLVGVDGVARLTDFGIAKSAQQASTTTTGALKGKLAYMAPEYIDGQPPDARSDVFGLGVVIWEALANRRLFRGESEVDTLKRILQTPAPPLSSVAPWVGAELDPVLAAALEKDPNERFASAKALGNALEIAARRADLVGSAEDVGALVRALLHDKLAERRRLIQERVAADVGPASGRPAGPAPEPRDPAAAPPPAPESGAPPAASAAPSAAVSGPRKLATTVRDIDADAMSGAAVESATAPREPPPLDRGASTLDGSGLSRPGFNRPSAFPPARSRRSLWLLAGAGALLAGGLAAAYVGQSTPSPTATGDLISTTAPTVRAATTAIADVAQVVADAPASADPSPAPPASSASLVSSAHPAASPSLAASLRKPPPPRATASATAAADAIPPNPYGAKP